MGYDVMTVQNRKENCHHDHIPFKLKENGILVFQVCRNSRRRSPQEIAPTKKVKKEKKSKEKK